MILLIRFVLYSLKRLTDLSAPSQEGGGGGLLPNDFGHGSGGGGGGCEVHFVNPFLGSNLAISQNLTAKIKTSFQRRKMFFVHHMTLFPPK